MKKSKKSTLAFHSASAVGRRASDPLTFICANHLAFERWKPRPSIYFESIFFEFFSGGGVTQKNRHDFHKNGRRGVIKCFPTNSFIARMRPHEASNTVKTDCRFVLCKMCHKHLIKIVFVKNNSYFVPWCSIAPKRFVAELSSNESKYVPKHWSSNRENRICVCQTLNFWWIFWRVKGHKTEILTFSHKWLPFTQFSITHLALNSAYAHVSPG